MSDCKQLSGRSRPDGSCLACDDEAKCPHQPESVWERDRLDRHVVQRIREVVQVSTMIEFELDEEGYYHHVLRAGGDERIWAIVQNALADGGWIICPILSRLRQAIPDPT